MAPGNKAQELSLPLLVLKDIQDHAVTSFYMDKYQPVHGNIKPNFGKVQLLKHDYFSAVSHIHCISFFVFKAKEIKADGGRKDQRGLTGKKYYKLEREHLL